MKDSLPETFAIPAFSALAALVLAHASILAAAPQQDGGAPKLLFKSGFEGTTLSTSVDIYGHGAWQNISGTDPATGCSWPPDIGVPCQMRLQLIVGVQPLTQEKVAEYIENRIETVIGHKGVPTKALHQVVKQRGFQSTQDTFMLQPSAEPGDLYVSFWAKLQPDLLEQNRESWKALFEWKTAGDYRVTTQIMTRGGVAYWRTAGDNVANGGLPREVFWTVENRDVAVPLGEWFKFEVFWHRSEGNDGRVWAAVAGKVIADHHGPLMGIQKKPINRIMIPNLYQGGATPQYQWVDDLEIWSGFPPQGDNPPYAPHRESTG